MPKTYNKIKKYVTFTQGHFFRTPFTMYANPYKDEYNLLPTYCNFQLVIKIAK